MWGPEQAEAFRRDGHVTLKGAFDADEARAMAEQVWSHVEANTPHRNDDPATWPAHDEWVGTSFKKIKRRAAFRAVLGSPTTRAALDGIFGPDACGASRNGAQILFTFPNCDPDDWRVPSKLWHMDARFFRRVDPPRAVKLFSVVEPLPPRGGATMILAGTPNLQAEYARQAADEHRQGNGQMWRRFMTRAGDDWLAAFARDEGEADRNDVLAGPREVAGHRIELRELGGEPGDVHVTHINCFHSASPNANGRPRMLVTHLVQPLAATEGLGYVKAVPA